MDVPSPPARRPARPRRGGKLLAALVALGVVGGLGVAAVKYDLTPAKLFPSYFQTARPDLVTHAVKSEYLSVSVVERGTLESADNKEVTCKVKAGSKGTYASTIRWVIDDGTLVVKGQPLMELDDSALQDSYRAQSIIVDKAKAEWVKADEDYIITTKTNLSDIATADAAADIAELELDKFLGLRADPALDPLGGLVGGVGTLTEKGDFQRRLDEASGLLKIAEADLEQYRDRAAWSERSVRLGYQTASQSRAEQSKLAGALENAEKLRKQRAVLGEFDRKKELTLLSSNLQVAVLKLDQAIRQARSKEVQAESTRKTGYSVYMQELEKLREIEEQIRQCKIYSPQDGMCVYYKDASGRWGSSSEGQIIQGAQVKEGQKLLRIPDLKRMQVNTKVHEAMVSRIRGDDRQSTGFFDTLRAGLLAGADPFGRLLAHSEHMQSQLREHYRADEYRLASPGQGASVRIDAFPDRQLKAHVRTVAAVASQQDWMSSDVKVYQTLVTIDDPVEGLKPDMSAEVTIQVDPPKEPVLAVPVQAIVGGAEGGLKRKVFVLTPAGPAEREVTLGLFNEKMVEVRDGVAEGDQVVLNPKVLLGAGAKTREESAEPARRGGMGGGKGGEGKKAGGKGGGGGMKAAGPALKP